MRGTRVRVAGCGAAIAAATLGWTVAPAGASQQNAFVAGDVALVPVRCPDAHRSCRGTLVLTVPSAALGHAVSVGQRGFTVPSGGFADVEVRIDSTARYRLSHGHGRTQVTDTEHFAGAQGAASSTASFTLNLLAGPITPP